MDGLGSVLNFTHLHDFFFRLNGLTGRKVQRIFEALAPSHVQNDARNLVEYCCFRYLSRDNSDLHPSLKVK
jgi:hypothetical protein